MNDTPNPGGPAPAPAAAPESLAAILREMRDLADHRAADAGGERPGIELLRSYADRIDAAAERERVEIRRDAEIEWTRIGYDERKAEEKRAPGNAAAMRAALERAVDAIETMCALYDEEHTSAVAIGAKWKHEDMTEVVAILASARAALSAPARNCDRLETHNEAKAAFLRSYFGPTEPEFVEDAFARWAFAPAEGGAK